MARPRNLRGLHAAVHERVPVDERGEEVGKGADGDVLLRQLDEPGVVAEKGQEPCAAQLGQQKEGQRDTHVQQQL